VKKTFALAVTLLFAAAALMASEDWRGNNRLAGVVIDKNTGKPVAGAKVSLRIQKGEKGGTDTTTDANGKWAILGLAAGAWDIDVEAKGYVVRQGNTRMNEGQRIPPLKIELEPEAVATATTTAEIPATEIKIGGQAVSKDIAEAVEAGNAALTAKNFKEAITDYEKASAALPGFVPIRFALARAYYGNGDLKKAIAAMDEVYKSDPTDVAHAMLLANMVLEDGQVERGREIMDKLPADALTDPTAVINIGIVLMNKKQPGAAVTYFTRAIGIDAKNVDAYYYRGLAKIQAGLAKESKADLEKVIELAPTSDEAKDAREYLKSIK
jgi:tetratricopeptide (TPR) repeat protein